MPSSAECETACAARLLPFLRNCVFVAFFFFNVMTSSSYAGLIGSHVSKLTSLRHRIWLWCLRSPTLVFACRTACAQLVTSALKPFTLLRLFDYCMPHRFRGQLDCSFFLFLLLASLFLCCCFRILNVWFISLSTYYTSFCIR